MTPLALYSKFPIQLSIAGKGESLAYSALLRDRNIWRLDLSNRSWKRLIASTGQDASPQYSPSGDKICFRSDRSGEEQLWVSNSDGSGSSFMSAATPRSFECLPQGGSHRRLPRHRERRSQPRGMAEACISYTNGTAPL